MPTQQPDPAFGRALAELRRQRGLTYRQLADRVPVTHTYLWELEAGRKYPPSAKVAAALDAEFSAGGRLVELAKRPGSTATTSAPPAQRGRGAHEQDDDVNRRQLATGSGLPDLKALISAVTTPFAGSQPDVDRNIDEVARRLSATHHDYQHGRYTTATAQLPALLNALFAAADADPDRLARLTAEAYQIASSLLLKRDEPVLAAIAAERSLATATAIGDNVALACSSRALVHCLTAGGHTEQGSAFAIHAADRLANGADMGSPSVLSVYGALVLRGAIAAARREDRDQALLLLDDAQRAAVTVGTDRNLEWTAFGPMNVAAHRVSIAVELGDAGTAVALAQKVDLGALEVPERRAMVLLDTARAYTQWAKWDRAFDAVQQAEQHAAEEVRARPATHRLINEIAAGSPSHMQRQVREYAVQVGAAA